MSESSWAGLAESIGSIRQELQQAMQAGAGQDLVFALGPVELELSVDVKKDVGGNIKVRVLSFGSAEAKAAIASGEASKLKLTLLPEDASGKSVRISSQSTTRPE
ncbi:trypco2 family protein [Streptomyces sp. NPDC006529]|uniref:trypco2 family protein n=1 Tax=Streptomyces sp. NPDC006529 TaxID=3157177 RepID=UPI00339E4938